MRVECKTLTFLSFWTFRKRQKSSLIVSSGEVDKRDWVCSLIWKLKQNMKLLALISDLSFCLLLTPAESVFAFKHWDLSAQDFKASETAVSYLQGWLEHPEKAASLCAQGARFYTLEKGWGEWSLCKKPVSRRSTATGYRCKRCCAPAGGHLAGREEKWLENSRCRMWGEAHLKASLVSPGCMLGHPQRTPLVEGTRPWRASWASQNTLRSSFWILNQSLAI